MPRDIPVGNGSLLVNFDKEYQLRDFYFPHIGKDNQTQGHPFRFGVWVDEMFSWIGPEWKTSIKYRPDTLVTDVVARNDRLRLELHMADAVDFHLNVYLREIIVKNLAGWDREVRLFFNNDFHISETTVGDTAYYDPQTRALVHYKGERYFLINGCDPTKCGVDHFCCGIKELPGMAGTWRDAEDGRLSGNPIARGSVDSTVGFNLFLRAGSENTAHYWIAAGTNYAEVEKLNRVVWDKTPEALIQRTASYWRLWVNKEEFNFEGVPQKVVDLFKRSLLILRTQIDNNGAILAANDYDVTEWLSDTYSYVWPRHGALAAYALIKAGYADIAQRFFDFCAKVIHLKGFFLHKYNPDGSLASSQHPWYRGGKSELPIQEDETALVLWVLWRYFDKFRSLESVKPLYRPVIINAAEFLATYRDKDTKLPEPSYDLWEERSGVHTFTVAAVVAGLQAAGKLASAFGENDRAEKYFSVAHEMREAMIKYLYHPAEGRFARMGTPVKEGYALDMTIDASLCGIFAFKTLPPDDVLVESTMNAVRNHLWVRTGVGGLARYTGDAYHRVSNDVDRVPGNPWFICTLWLADYEIARAKTLQDLDKALPLLEWVADRALESGVLGEQVDPYTGEPLSACPMTWSHAALVITTLSYLEKRRRLRDGKLYLASLYQESRYMGEDTMSHVWESEV